MRTRNLLLGLVVATTTLFTHQAQAQNINVGYYTPQFYVDRLVFYDTAGAPIYYEGDVAYAVPRSYNGYSSLVENYNANVDNYYRWFQEVGYLRLNHRRPITTSYYQPQYYDDIYPVFYNGRGQPIYYIDGVVHRIPRTYPRYHLYINHYRGRRAAYLRWYAGPGRHYRRYRRPISSGYYTPQYYDGYVVFYSGDGRPYYYMGNRMVYIPSTHRRYGSYTSHYRRHRANYRRWYTSRGRRYHRYRRSTHYRQRRVASRAPRARRGRALERRYRRRHNPHRPGPIAAPGPRPRRHMGPRPGPRRPVVGPGPRRHVRRPIRPAPRRVERRVDCRRQPGHPSCRGRHAPPRVERRQNRREHRQERRQERRERRQDRRRRRHR